MWIVAPVAAASRPWPETWSAWLWVSRTCSIAHAHVAGELEVLVDLEARVDDRRHARVLVADQIRGAAEVVMDDLTEDHAPTLSERQRLTEGWVRSATALEPVPTQPVDVQIGCTISVIHFDESGSSRGLVT